jgi:glycosyltransferase involved in cell wall biosynthesis
METHSLTVLIPTHGRPTLLERTLASLTECTLPDSYRELVVIENGSRTEAEQIVADLPERINARYMHRERGNKSYALNEALATIADGLVVFFDDDVQVSSEVLTAYAEAADMHGPGHFFGGPVEVDCSTDPPAYLTSLFPRSARGYDLETSRMGDKYIGFNWAAFAQDLKQTGGFDPQFGPGSPSGATGQESDMQHRLIEDDHVGIDVPDALVCHHVPDENVTLRWLLRRHFRGGIRPGIETESTWWCFAVKILWQTVISFGVAIKGAVLLDLEKMAFVLANTFQRVGFVKGYLWKHWNDHSNTPVK